MLGEDRLALVGDLAVLELGAGLGADVDVVQPAAEGAVHVELGWGAEGQDAAGGFAGDAGSDHFPVEVVDLSEDVACSVAVAVLCGGGQVVVACLAVGGVLTAEVGCFGAVGDGVAGAELLEGEGAVAEDLCGDVTLGVDLDAERRHFEG